MANKYNSVLRLIELWQVYEEEHDAPQLCNFASWMTEKLQSEPDLNVVSAPKRAKIDEPANAVLFQQMDESARFLEYLSRIARLHDFYIKKFFGELQINNRLDYLFPPLSRSYPSKRLGRSAVGSAAVAVWCQALPDSSAVRWLVFWTVTFFSNNLLCWVLRLYIQRMSSKIADCGVIVR